MKNLLNKNSPYLFFVRFLGCFFILYIFFPFYRGVIGDGGKLHSAFLASHFNIVTGLTHLLTRCASFLLETAGYQLQHTDYRSLRIDSSRGVVVNPSCLGWAVMSFWVAFVYANTGSVLHKLKWMLTGIVAIVVLNIVRIALIVLANHLNWATITSLDHHQTFNIASYGCIITLTGWYIRVQKKYERIELKGKKTGRTLSTI